MTLIKSGRGKGSCGTSFKWIKSSVSRPCSPSADLIFLKKYVCRCEKAHGE
uniref:Uncharacterized protein n=1 Tax=Anguilla anguilla TaxID=7936 RepID=A0A0E9U535_ANGAN